MVSNGTHVWINESVYKENGTVDLSGCDPSGMKENDTFMLPNASPQANPAFEWEIYSVGGQYGNETLQIRHANRVICGMGENGLIRIVPPSGHDNYQTYYYAMNYLVRQNDWFANQMGMSDRVIYVYHNTTHVWFARETQGITNFTNQSEGPVPAGGVINDTFGGKWKVLSINR